MPRNKLAKQGSALARRNSHLEGKPSCHDVQGVRRRRGGGHDLHVMDFRRDGRGSEQPSLRSEWSPASSDRPPIRLPRSNTRSETSRPSATVRPVLRKRGPRARPLKWVRVPYLQLCTRRSPWQAGAVDPLQRQSGFSRPDRRFQALSRYDADLESSYLGVLALLAGSTRPAFRVARPVPRERVLLSRTDPCSGC
jgi:hypothetical protein